MIPVWGGHCNPCRPRSPLRSVGDDKSSDHHRLKSALELAKATQLAVGTPDVQRGGADGGGDGREGEQGTAFPGVVPGVLARVMGVALCSLAVFLQGLARGMSCTVEDLLATMAGVVAEVRGALTGFGQAVADGVGQAAEAVAQVSIQLRGSMRPRRRSYRVGPLRWFSSRAAMPTPARMATMPLVMPGCLRTSARAENWRTMG